MTLPLTLCIPTYNRAALLGQSLRAILSQVTFAIADQVEVLVLDNASPDDTPAVVARARAEFPHVSLRSIRRPENIGCDANFCDAPRQAWGEFVYLLSDDDVLLPGAVERLLSLVREHPGFDAFALNVRQFRDSPEEEDMPPVVVVDADRVVHSRDEALFLLKMHIVFISCVAFRRANVAHEDYRDRRGTNMAQSYMFLDALLPGRGVYFTHQTYLAQCAGRAEGYNFFRVWITNFHDLMSHARRIGYSPQAVQGVLAESLRYIYHYVIIFKSMGNYDQLRPNYPDAVLRLLRTYRVNRYVLLRLIPRILVPRAFFIPLQKLHQRVKLRLSAVPAPPPTAPAERQR